MRNKGWQSYRRQEAKLSVVVVEEEGELVGLVMDPTRPVVKVRLGKLQPPAFDAGYDCR